MKAVVFIAKFASGGVESFADESFAKVNEIATKARKCGTYNGEPITGGIVLSTQHLGPMVRFKCTQPAPEKKKK